MINSSAPLGRPNFTLSSDIRNTQTATIHIHQQKAMTMIIIHLVNRMSGGGEGVRAAVGEQEGFIFNRMSLLWQKTDVIHVLIYTYLHTYTCNWVWAYLENVIKSIYGKCCFRSSERYCRNWHKFICNGIYFITVLIFLWILNLYGEGFRLERVVQFEVNRIIHSRVIMSSKQTDGRTDIGRITYIALKLIHPIICGWGISLV